MILVDTSVWIDFLRGTNSLHRKTLHALIENEEDVCLTGIILTEILQGIRDEKENNEIKRYLLEFPLYNPADVSTYIKAADIFRKCARQGRTVRKTIDCLIAAVAMENNFTLLHNDRDFDAIADCTELKLFRRLN